MRSSLAVATLLVLVAGCSRDSSSPPGVRKTNQIAGMVTRATGGDLITIEVDGTPYVIRLYGIDAPEVTQPYYDRSNQELQNRVLKKLVRAEIAGFRPGPRPNAWVWLADAPV